MHNTLFIVCSFSNVENEIKRKYGRNAFFVSCPGAIIPYNDHQFIEILKDEIIKHKIKLVYFVNDTSSRIIHSVLFQKDLFGLDAEYYVEKIYKNACPISLKGRSIQYQLFRLAELIVQKQKNDFLSNDIFIDLIIDERISVKTIVISQALKIIKESRIVAPFKLKYEL